MGFFGSSWWTEWGGMIIGALLLIGVIIAVSVSSGKKRDSENGKGTGTITFNPWRSGE